jgi:nitrite reductase/ring-hydroxylating ferredoxin subunit
MPTIELPIDALPFDTPYALEAEGMKIVAVRTATAIYAFEDSCPHAFWPLSAGSFRDGVLECPGHAWEFQIETGRCQDSPAYCLAPVATTILGETVRFEWRSVPSKWDAVVPANKHTSPDDDRLKILSQTSE